MNGIEVGPYELLREVGRGSVAVVYRARCFERDREYALRFLVAEGANAGLRERFIREGRAAAALPPHPGIVTVHEVGEHKDSPYVVMDVVEGRTLASIAAHGELSPPEAVSIMSKAARAMQHAHDHGVLHRDLNPSNILLADSRMPRITGFGPSKSRVADEGVRALTGMDEVVGTPEYMAPEQVRGEEATPATDVYALGAILYALCTTRPPFGRSDRDDDEFDNDVPDADADADAAEGEGDDGGRGAHGAGLHWTLSSVLKGRPVSPRKLNRMVEPALEAVLFHAMHTNPAKRYQSALEFAEDLERLLQGTRTIAKTGVAAWLPW